MVYIFHHVKYVARRQFVLHVIVFYLALMVYIFHHVKYVAHSLCCISLFIILTHMVYIFHHVARVCAVGHYLFPNGNLGHYAFYNKVLVVMVMVLAES